MGFPKFLKIPVTDSKTTRHYIQTRLQPAVLWSAEILVAPRWCMNVFCLSCPPADSLGSTTPSLSQLTQPSTHKQLYNTLKASYHLMQLLYEQIAEKSVGLWFICLNRTLTQLIPISSFSSISCSSPAPRSWVPDAACALTPALGSPGSQGRVHCWVALVPEIPNIRPPSKRGCQEVI